MEKVLAGIGLPGPAFFYKKYFKNSCCFIWCNEICTRIFDLSNKQKNALYEKRNYDHRNVQRF